MLVKDISLAARSLRRSRLIAVVAVVTIGIGVGLVAALGVKRFLEQLLYGVEPMDGVTTSVAMFVLVAAALVASYVPARHLRRIHPPDVLRSD